MKRAAAANHHIEFLCSRTDIFIIFAQKSLTLLSGMSEYGAFCSQNRGTRDNERPRTSLGKDRLISNRKLCLKTNYFWTQVYSNYSAAHHSM